MASMSAMMTQCAAAGRVSLTRRSAAARGSSSPRTAGLSTTAPQLLRRHSANHQRTASVHKVRATSESAPETPVSASDGKPGSRMVYAPATFSELLEDAGRAIKAGIDDGLKFMEVEFPPVPGQVDGYKGASDTFIDANIQLALVGARQLTKSGLKVHVVLPDDAEYDRAKKMFASTLELEENVTLGYLTEKDGPSFRFSLKGLGIGSSNSMYESKIPKEKETKLDAEAADVFIAINASAIELLEVEEYHTTTVKDRPMVLWNLELDTLRADLGLLGFPPRDLQYRFLSRFKPVFYIRQRDYSKTVNVAPFILNYSGSLFREYPGPWQVMLKQDSGELACIAERSERYTLTEAKEEMMETMGLNTEEEGSTMAFLRRGYKLATWWEEDRDKEAHNDWRQ